MRPFSDPQLNPAREHGWRGRWFDIIYHHDSRPSRNFDLLLVGTILASVLVIMLDSVPRIHQRWSAWLYPVEWGFTVLFTAEYLLRLAVVRRPLRYALSVWGLIDLLSILPSYLSFFVPGAQTLLIVRVLRILRLFRILKLTRYVEESGILMQALWRSRRKVLVFLFTIITITVIAGAMMYVIEGPTHGFTSIPTSMYWAIVTMATVGFGDLVPQTTLGRFVTSALILTGYSIIAVPTGIYTAELASSLRQSDDAQRHDGRGCTDCGLEGHDRDARYCRACG
ncbi:ion transporter, partial [Xanthomonas sp. Kuri4-1]